MIEVSIESIILEKMRSHLTQKLFDEPDELKATVTVGKPAVREQTEGRIQVFIYPEDENGFGPSEMLDSGLVSISPYLVAGGSFSHRKYVVELSVGVRSTNQQDGMRQSSAVIGRCNNALGSMSMPLHPTTNQPQDDFKEGIVLFQVGKQKQHNAIGAPKSMVHKVTQVVDFWTYRP